jgi:hypothetical protein
MPARCRGYACTNAHAFRGQDTRQRYAVVHDPGSTTGSRMLLHECVHVYTDHPDGTTGSGEPVAELHAGKRVDNPLHWHPHQISGGKRS